VIGVNLVIVLPAPVATAQLNVHVPAISTTGVKGKVIIPAHAMWILLDWNHTSPFLLWEFQHREFVS
jgi:hypothetical protein